jgi:hypothetical protein
MTSTSRWPRRLGRLTGAIVAAALLAQGSVARGTEVPPLRLSLQALPSGETEVAPPGHVLTAAALVPGGTGAVVALRLRDQTGLRTDVHVRAVPATVDPAVPVQVRVSAGARTLFAGPLRGLRRWTAAARLAPGGETPLTLRAWIPRGVRSGYQARVLELQLEVRSEVVTP